MVRARFAAAIAVAALVACSIYDSSLLLPAPTDGGGSDGGGDATGDDSGDGCNHARWPGPPAADDPSSGDVDIVVALRSIDLGFGDDAGSDSGLEPGLGYDLDDRCTCPAPESCTPPVVGTMNCDDTQGRDRSGNQLLDDFAAVSNGVISTATINNHLNRGDYGLVVHIRKYNGQPNDTQIEFSIYVSNGIEQPPPPPPMDAGDDGGDDGGEAGPPPPDAGPVIAKWDGTDRFTLDSDSVFGGANDAGIVIPNFADLKAYVSGGTFVAQLPELPLNLIGGGSSSAIEVVLSATVLTGKLVKEADGSWVIEGGVVGGRWETKNLLTALHVVRNPVGPGYICPGTQVYDGVKMRVCRGADIAADPTQDNTGHVCSAISIALGYRAQGAQMGPISVRAMRTDPCGDAGRADDCP